MTAWLLGGTAAAILVLLTYWLFHITEGAFLGARIVVLLYDWSASRYDAIKGFTRAEESWFLARPLMSQLSGVGQPLILDVATGTGRLPYALLRETDFQGRVVGLDASHRMLAEAVPKLEDDADRVLLLHHRATPLPFAEHTFDAVACLEALEFLPNARETLGEMVRVLRPGGVLMTTNRRGWEARLFPGRTFSQRQIVDLLEELGLGAVRVQSWQVIYDLVWARKPDGVTHPTGEDRQPPLTELVRCPHCHSATLEGAASGESTLQCPHCGTAYRLDGLVAALRAPR